MLTTINKYINDILINKILNKIFTFFHIKY